MLNELKHIFEGTLRGFTTEDRQKDGQSYKVDVMVIDEDMESYRVTMKRVDADDLKKTVSAGAPICVETLVRAYPSGLGVSYLRVLPGSTKTVKAIK